VDGHCRDARPPLILYTADLTGVAVFAVSGALAAERKGLDIFGVIVIASVTAIGGGTVRDLLLNRHPIFWIADPRYLIVIAAAAVLTAFTSGAFPPPANALLVADALGLGLFTLSGALIAETAGLSPIIVVLMGTMTGAAGGVIRDLLTADIPLILRRDIYATAAIAGVALYLVLRALGMKQPWAFGIGMAAVVLLRLLAIQLRWQLPTFNR
jgi:uncharacterized membrane protein YeiH